MHRRASKLVSMSCQLSISYYHDIRICQLHQQGRSRTLCHREQWNFTRGWWSGNMCQWSKVWTKFFVALEKKSGMPTHKQKKRLSANLELESWNFDPTGLLDWNVSICLKTRWKIWHTLVRGMVLGRHHLPPLSRPPRPWTPRGTWNDWLFRMG